MYDIKYQLWFESVIRVFATDWPRYNEPWRYKIAQIRFTFRLILRVSRASGPSYNWRYLASDCNCFLYFYNEASFASCFHTHSAKYFTSLHWIVSPLYWIAVTCWWLYFKICVGYLYSTNIFSGYEHLLRWNGAISKLAWKITTLGPLNYWPICNSYI